MGVGTTTREVRGDEPKDAKAGPAGQASKAGPRSVKGRVVGPDGKPVAGAKVVDLEYLAPTTTIDENDYRMGSGNWPWTRRELDHGVTDTEGRFALSITPSDPDPSTDANTRMNWNLPLVLAQRRDTARRGGTARPTCPPTSRCDW